MNPHDPTTCDLFDEHVDELALGQIDEPLRSRLLAHAASCPQCHTLLDGLGAVADRLLLGAPQLEPPAGFEGRVLARLHSAEEGKRPGSLRRWVGGAVAAALLVAAGAAAVWRLDRSDSAATAAIVAVSGSEIGTAQLVDTPAPHIVVTIASPRPGPGRRMCELRLTGGDWETVGWWDATDIESGVWAVGIDARLLDAAEMRVTADGEVVATASFD
jgi:anti-sigma factor RsiW